MKFEELPEDTVEEIRGLKYGSMTIEADVQQTLEEAENIKDFKEGVTGRMKSLIEEAQGVIASLGTGEKDMVYVTIHIHRGVIYNTAVYAQRNKAVETRDEWVRDTYGDVKEEEAKLLMQIGDDVIDLQECQVMIV